MHITKISDILKIYKYHIKPKGEINMKNKKTSYKKVHKKIDSQTIHINKRWSDLKRTQREFIYNLMRKNYKQFLDENDKLPNKKEQSVIELSRKPLGLPGGCKALLFWDKIKNNFLNNLIKILFFAI